MSAGSDRNDKGSGPEGGVWRRLVVVGCLAIPLAVPAADDAADGNEYLKLIQSEALKIKVADPVTPESAKADVPAVEIGTFENELEGQYRGSYLFYKKLPRRAQEEIFLEYQKGASIDDIRKKIMNRFLHSK